MFTWGLVFTLQQRISGRDNVFPQYNHPFSFSYFLPRIDLKFDCKRKSCCSSPRLLVAILDCDYVHELGAEVWRTAKSAMSRRCRERRYLTSQSSTSRRISATFTSPVGVGEKLMTSLLFSFYNDYFRIAKIVVLDGGLSFNGDGWLHSISQQLSHSKYTD